MPGNLISITPEDIQSWPEPNYNDPVQRKWMPPYTITLCAASTIMLGLRLWLRATKKAGNLGLDDLLLLGAWVTVVLFTALCNLAALRYDVGRHLWDIPVQFFENIAEITWLAEFCFLFCGGCTKISVLLFYRRLVGDSYDKRWKWAVIGAIIFTAAWTLSFMLCLVFNCNPTQAYWKAFDPTWHRQYSCVDTTFINLLAGIFAIASDIYSIALPCLVTRNFRIPSGQKLALNAIFLAGILVVAASIVRTYYLYEVGHNSDVSWLIFDVYVWAQVELQLGIMLASAPALRIFFRRYLNKPINRAVHTATGSLNPRSAERSGSRFSSHNVDCSSGSKDSWNQRDEYSPTRDQAKSDFAQVSVIEQGGSFLSTAPSTDSLIRSPEDYEAYNLQRLEHCRQSLDKRGGRAPNFSQPFGWHHTTRGK
ncbi:hypothetical protein KC340_g3538 [Hortaea werneckii]|nr:hypothetical protein KC342_g7598 [Hortaea werneckii]KAI7103323.1 hypothetical protein KC339_g5360 [Hortaea werneckii]KAI7237060.1 hypothetical protein KC365_g4915 [Hortaea werneckii]KAI7332057.1 hypothetical protein KC340_g3538 [Hortaea werneckii]KAI7400655.1 hypothetical protein KC328_g3498 [Hortaea werneckii]